MSNIDTVKRIFALLDANDWGTLRGMAAPNAMWHLPGGMTFTGWDEFQPFCESCYAGFPGLPHTIEEIIQEGDKVAVRVHITAKHTATWKTPLGDVPATGEAIDFISMNIATFEGGLLRSWSIAFDQLAVMSQLGLVPEPAGV